MADENTKIKEKKIERIIKVKAAGRDLPISKKHAVAVCAAIRGKKVRNVQGFLEAVMKKKKSIAMKGEIPHRKGAKRPGRYPIKTTGYIIRLLNDLVANANLKNLDIENLRIIKAIANQASRPYRGSRIAYGRKRLKRTHVDLEAESEEVKVKEKKKAKEIKKEEAAKEKKEEKPEAKKEEKKAGEKKEIEDEERKGSLKDGLNSDIKKVEEEKQ